MDPRYGTWLHVTILTPRILRWFLVFLENVYTPCMSSYTIVKCEVYRIKEVYRLRAKVLKLTVYTDCTLVAMRRGPQYACILTVHFQNIMVHHLQRRRTLTHDNFAF